MLLCVEQQINSCGYDRLSQPSLSKNLHFFVSASSPWADPVWLGNLV
jgi:hypothetical protein